MYNRQHCLHRTESHWEENSQQIQCNKRMFKKWHNIQINQFHPGKTNHKWSNSFMKWCEKDSHTAHWPVCSQLITSRWISIALNLNSLSVFVWTFCCLLNPTVSVHLGGCGTGLTRWGHLHIAFSNRTKKNFTYIFWLQKRGRYWKSQMCGFDSSYGSQRDKKLHSETNKI